MEESRRKKKASDLSKKYAMINPEAKLVADIFANDIEKRSTRDGFGAGVVEAGKKDPRVVVLTADLAESTRADVFQKAFPQRFIEVGVAEQNLAALAAGMAAVGKIPFITSYAAFSPGRNYEQIRTTIALNRMPVKIMGTHAGVTVGPDGGTHQMLEDIGMMRMLPGMTVMNPCDAEEARKAVIDAALHDGPVYIRFGRSDTPVFSTRETPFQIGKALKLWQSDKPKVAFVSTGAMSYNALMAARALDTQGIGSIVLHYATVKPLDADALIEAARRTGRVITIEEHQVAGGFGSAVAEFLTREYPVPVHMLGVQDTFGQSGTPDELIEHCGLSPSRIVDASRKFLS
jgi:transketolase